MAQPGVPDRQGLLLRNERRDGLPHLVEHQADMTEVRGQTRLIIDDGGVIADECPPEHQGLLKGMQRLGNLTRRLQSCAEALGTLGEIHLPPGDAGLVADLGFENRHGFSERPKRCGRLVNPILHVAVTDSVPSQYPPSLAVRRIGTSQRHQDREGLLEGVQRLAFSAKKRLQIGEPAKACRQILAGLGIGRVLADDPFAD